MKVIKKKKIVESLIFSKICLGHSTKFIDDSHFKFLIGSRPKFFSLINPFLLKASLKSGLLALESFVKSNYKVIIIVNIDDPIIFAKFFQICKTNNILLIKSSEVSLGFLTSRRLRDVVLVTLFLTPLKTELIQKEIALIGLPMISFGSLLTNKNSSFLHVGGNFNLLTIQNLILTLLTICLEKKNESA
jgi:hypothetical protein